jgi:hypothetical protein
MKSNNTIIYYSACTEKPEFEAKIIANLKKQAQDNNLPIISVTRKPIDLGKNICIGEQPVCYSNSFKQILIGLKEAKTKFCIAAESDCLYPPEYFQLTYSQENKVCRYTNIWVHFDGRDKFWKKNWVEGAQMCEREYWIKSIEAILEKPDSWEPEPFKFIFKEKDESCWSGKNPVLYFKTREGIGFKTGYNQDIITKELPYWGTALEVKEKYL